MNPSQMVETYKFWDVASLWATERLENETVIARAMARGIITDGLRFQSVDPRWVKADRSLTGRPYVGYAANPEKSPVLLRVEALEHLLAIVRQAATPTREGLAEEFVARDDFRNWLEATGQTPPSFWFTASERKVEA
ncbi:MAG: hypothetical protein ABW220_16210 [Burkholderiaceae bacterium]